MAQQKVRRSGLTMPIVTPRFVDQAWRRGCDFVTLDLEDSVPQNRKDYARTLVKESIPKVTRAGTEAIEALFAEGIDITFIGPNPAINAFAQSDGEAIRIMTGAPVPAGADAIVMVEDTERLENGTRVRVRTTVSPGSAVRAAGSDVRSGQRVFAAGTVLNGPSLGVLASINARRVKAVARARVALLSTGDELVVDGSALKPGQIRESNLTMLDRMICDTGCEVVNLGIVRSSTRCWTSPITSGVTHRVSWVAGRTPLMTSTMPCTSRMDHWREFGSALLVGDMVHGD